MMKKKERDMNNQNIVLFPGLKDRLLVLGLEHLDNHRYAEAADLLSQANEIDPEDPEIGISFLLALYESGNYENAKVQCNKLLYRGIGDYFEIIDVFLMILIQLSEHDEVVHTINALIEENEVPIEKKEHYEKLLLYSEKRISTHINHNQTHDEIESEHSLFSNNDITEQIMKVAQLTNKNIRPFISELTTYLLDTSSHPFIQTMVINVLKEHGSEKEFVVKKFQYEETIIPANLNSIFETPFYTTFINDIKVKIENENPSFFEQIKSIIDRHFFLLYPFELSPVDTHLWTAAYQCLGFEFYGEDVNIEKIAKQYGVDFSTLENAMNFIHKLEEISLPIL